ncbi:hypothetical protein EW027_15605 [Aeribacillus pallidus]|uniref:hypothetical protein n=1 Tax=Aeribacillus pallidus TaxID=33936 RepID=UPI001022DD55|nr:hypothetical protein [Aeribacillus pallidus]RZI50402.1 hypothetical protein EW027_15605 [Aeribacillus pallidus]
MFTIWFLYDEACEKVIGHKEVINTPTADRAIWLVLSPRRRKFTENLTGKRGILIGRNHRLSLKVAKYKC